MGSLASGQIVTHTDLDVGNIYQVSAGFCCGGALFFLAVYYLVGVNAEKKVLRAKEEIMHKEDDA